MDIPQEGTVGAYLRGYGYAVDMEGSWKDEAPHPELCLQVRGHEEIDGHTFYTVHCVLQTEGLKLRWDEPFRLVHLRKFLHDPLKSSLGTCYQKHFARAPFALRGGIVGTTARLDAWCNALAACINARGCAPGIVWLALCFLQVPEVLHASPLSPRLEMQEETPANGVYGPVFHGKPAGTETEGLPDDAGRDPEETAETPGSAVANADADKPFWRRHRRVEDPGGPLLQEQGKAGIWPGFFSSIASMSSAPALEQGKEAVCEEDEEDNRPQLVLSQAQPRNRTTFEGEPVWLHIYDVCAGSVQVVNNIFRKAGTGAFHAAVEVFGCEWSFGFTAGGTGVYSCPPRSNTQHEYRESVLMGSTKLSEKELHELLQQLRISWQGPSYHLLQRNCCHFSNTLCDGLGVGPVPRWVMNLAGAGAAIMGGVKAVADFAAVVKGEYQSACASAGAPVDRNLM